MSGQCIIGSSVLWASGLDVLTRDIEAYSKKKLTQLNCSKTWYIEQYRSDIGLASVYKAEINAY